MNEDGRSTGRSSVVAGVDGSAGSLEALGWADHAFATLGDTGDVEVERAIVQGRRRGS